MAVGASCRSSRNYRLAFGGNVVTAEGRLDEAIDRALTDIALPGNCLLRRSDRLQTVVQVGPVSAVVLA